MLDIFSGLRLVVKRRSTNIDNSIFRCHWFFTSTLLVSFSLIITARQYVGQPIECHSVNKLPDSLLNSYCWVQSTFTVPQACNQQVGIEVPYPCIDNTRGREIKVFAYYQWVGIVLFIQGLLFHLPYYLWKLWENGLIKTITGGLRVAVLSDQERAKKKDIVVDYIHNHLGCHKRYAIKYFLCEFICLINLLGQLWATNKFFDGQFLRYGLDVMQYSSSSLSSHISSSSSSYSSTPQSENRTSSTQSSTTLPINRNNLLQTTKILQTTRQHQVDPMTYIFPRITKCTYYDFGSSGDVQKHDALCLLPLNIINEKIYIALWFWFLILAILTLLVIVYRLCSIVSENVRCKGLISRCRLSSENDIKVICSHCDVGDWFLFYMLADNLDPIIMREIVGSTATKIRNHFELKKKLGDDYPLEHNVKYGQQQYLIDESLPTTRHNSLADEVPLVKKLKKRSYAKRLWSMDLGSGELRQQLFGQQPATNPDARYQQVDDVHCSPGANFNGTDQTTVSSLLVSAPPVGQMSLGSAPQSAIRYLAAKLQRRGSLTRMGSSSTSSTSDSFIMEMQPISGSSSRLNELPTNVERGDTSVEAIRHNTANGGRPMLRHRNSYQHRLSMRDLSMLNAPNSRDTEVA